PGSPALPLDAPSFAQIAEVIGQYLTDGGPATVLDARLNEWGAISTYGGLVRADRDFNGDTVPEVLVVAL
ncbi:MAG: hypothetical protein GWO02_17055, partial [Gammaproteobacteria bacterium]|nr:hypothetical protein [Gammaproteobacteria bacterium]